MKRLVLLLIALLILLLAGCDAQESAPTPVPTPTPADWLSRAVGTWNETESFHFTLALANRTIALDESGALSFDQAEGNVVAPDQVEATTLIKTPLGSVKVSVIAIGEEQWLTNPLSGRWEVAPPAMQAPVSAMFDPEQGIGAVLAEMEQLERLPDEQVEGAPTIHLRGTLPGALLSEFAADLAEEPEVTVDLWIGQSDGRLQRVLITEPAEGGVSPTWTFDFSQYNEVPAIEAPL